MTDRSEHYAREAQRLIDDQILMAAFNAVRLKALTELAEVDATNADEIRRLQAIANSLQEVRDELFNAIIAAGKMDGGMNPNGPTA